MARPLPSFAAHNLPFSSMPITVFFALIAVFSIFSIVTFLCGSKRVKKLVSEMEEEETGSDGFKDKKRLSKLTGNISNRALSMVKMLSWKKAQAEGEEEETGSDGFKDKKRLSKLTGNISDRALSMVKMLSWKKAQAEGEEEEEYLQDEDEALWRKTILMGERCRPLDFSGKIVYDSHGNMLPELSHQRIQNGHH